MPARRIQSLMHNGGGQHVVFHREHRTKKNRVRGLANRKEVRKLIEMRLLSAERRDRILERYEEIHGE